MAKHIEFTSDKTGLDAAEQKHLQGCPDCQAHWRIWRQIPQAVSQIPAQAPPLRLRELVQAAFTQPILKFRYLLSALFLLALSPILLQKNSSIFQSYADPQAYMIGMMLFVGTLVFSLVFISARQALQRHEQKFTSMLDSLDHDVIEKMGRRNKPL